MYEDAEFPATVESIYGEDEVPECSVEFTWRRPHEICEYSQLFQGCEGMQPKGSGNVRQGQHQGVVDNRYFASAVAVLAQNAEMLPRLFAGRPPKMLPRSHTVGGLHYVSGEETREAYGERFRRAIDRVSQQGRCDVRLFVTGNWQYFTVDTLLPCVDRSLAFCGSRDGSEVYAALLEKAYAKAYGSYAEISRGELAEALHNLTGAAIEELELTSLRDASASLDSFWDTLLRHRAGGDLIACTFHDGTVDDDSSSDGSSSRVALLPDLACPITGLAEVSSPMRARLVRVCNPWNDFVWRGDWGPGCEHWSKALCQELEYDRTQTDIFWMELSDLLEHFNRLHIVRAGVLAEKECKSFTLNMEVTPESSGGSSSFISFHQNQMLRLTCEGPPQEIMLTLAQPDLRHSEGDVPGSYPQIGVTVLEQNFHPRVTTDTCCCTPNRWTLLKKTVYDKKREVSMSFRAEPLPAGREYRIVPSCYFPEDPGMGRFYVTISWKGEADVKVECLKTDAAKSDITVSGNMAAAELGSDEFHYNPCYRVLAGESPTPITVMLTKTSERSRAWAASDPLHFALRALFDAFDDNDNGALEPAEMLEMWRSIAALDEGISHEEFDEGAFAATLHEFDCTNQGKVTFGQFMAHSTEIISVLRVPKPELARCIEDLAEWKKKGKKSSLPKSSEGPSTQRRNSTARRNSAGGANPAGPIPQAKRRESLPPLGSRGSVREFEVAALPLRCSAEEYKDLKSSLAPGCPDMPEMSNVAVWSASYVVQSKDFFICPIMRGSTSTCAYELRVLSPSVGVQVVRVDKGNLVKKKEPVKKPKPQPKRPMHNFKAHWETL